MKKTVLIIAPHPDDELGLAGRLIPRLIRIGYIVKVIIVTNGDANISGKIRLKESIKGLGILGVKKKDIIFLGYGNRWQGEEHIYNRKNTVLKSLAGYEYTYALDFHKEFHYKKYCEPALYTRENMLGDMRECIEEIWADIIICVDFDSHPDHRAVSLMFEECMNFLIRNKGYQPIVLKRFAYAFAWHGDNTAYAKKLSRFRVFDDKYQLDNPYYYWNERVVCKLDKCRICDFKLMLASLAYLSQNASSHLRQLLKKDMVFWNRRTDNLMYDAIINVSSGDKNFLFDFLRFGCVNVNKVKSQNAFWERYAWEPHLSDKKKEITIEWEKKVYISYISIFSSINDVSKILDCVIVVNNKDYHTGSLVYDMKKNIFINTYTKKILIRIDKYKGNSPGISEIEIYAKNKQDGLETFIESVEMLNNINDN